MEGQREANGEGERKRKGERELEGEVNGNGGALYNIGTYLYYRRSAIEVTDSALPDSLVWMEKGLGSNKG